MKKRRGSAMIEFILVGIPLMFLLISIFEMARGTMAYAIKEGVRYAIVHGENCDPDSSSNNCMVKIQDIAARIRDAGVGLDTSLLTVTFTYTGTRTVPTRTLQAHLADTTTYWPDNGAGSDPPTDAGSAVGMDLTISAAYPFTSALAMFWPGAGGVGFGVFNMPASSTERIAF